MKISVTLLFISSFILSFNSFGQVTFKVDANETGVKISQDLIGVFFEDINYAADGGLYAELVQNRSFEYYPVDGYTTLQPLSAWSLVSQGGAAATMAIENTNPLNTNNTKYLKFDVTVSGSKVGIRNSGFNGIAVKAGDKYDFSTYLRCSPLYEGEIIVQLENTSGEVLGRDTIKSVTTEWIKYSLEIVSNQTTSANLNMLATDTGTLYFDMVSLFPQNTFKNRENGLRNDLAQAIADLKPRFLRFPGGCISHGRGNDNAYRWKATVGKVEERTPNWNLWGYHQTYGLGFYEYFLFSEDIGAKPLPVIPVGVSCQFRNREIIPINQMGPWVQDAIDLVEFANGDTTSKWGKVRAEMGHPEPFNMEYICLGNEEDDIPEFRTRFLMIVDSLRKYHPEIKIIGTSGTAASGGYYNSLWQFSRENNLDAVDEHYYMAPNWFLNNVHRYDNFDRNGPKVFIGEYASQDDRLANAIAEASYLTGVEKNADIIQFTCYAPLLCNVNNNQWNPDLIRFDNTNVVKTASYHVQKLFSIYSGDEYFPGSVTYDEDFSTVTSEYHGKIGVGTWNTQSSFDNVKVVSGEKVLIEENFESGSSNWTVVSGTFATASGVYTQSSSQQPAVSVFNTSIDTSVYTFTLRARKNSGNEGFLIPFGYVNNQNYYWLNIAGWNNTQHAVEKVVNGSKSVLLTKGGSIQTGTWYEIKIEVAKNSTKIYLNNSLLFELPEPAGPFTASVVKDFETDEMIIKMVNSASKQIDASVNIENLYVSQEAPVITLTGGAAQENSIGSPNLLVPVESTFYVTNSFTYTLPANSFQVFRIKMDPGFQKIKEKDINKNKSGIQIIPNPMKRSALIMFENGLPDIFCLSVYDNSGRLVLKKENIQGNKIEFDSGNLSAGTYIIKLDGISKTYTDKLIITN